MAYKGQHLTVTPVTITPQPDVAEAADAVAAGDDDAQGGGAQEPQAKRQRVEGGGGAPAAGSADTAGGAAAVQWPGTGPGAARPVPSVAYVCELATVPGKFDPKKAVELGVPKGPVSERGAAVRMGPMIRCVECVWLARNPRVSSLRCAVLL